MAAAPMRSALAHYNSSLAPAAPEVYNLALMLCLPCLQRGLLLPLYDFNFSTNLLLTA